MDFEFTRENSLSAVVYLHYQKRELSCVSDGPREKRSDMEILVLLGSSRSFTIGFSVLFPFAETYKLLTKKTSDIANIKQLDIILVIFKNTAVTV